MPSDVSPERASRPAEAQTEYGALLVRKAQYDHSSLLTTPLTYMRPKYRGAGLSIELIQIHYTATKNVLQPLAEG